MKKKILSLILVLMLLPIASFFVGCDEDKGYNLNNLQNDFNLIVYENNNIAQKNDSIVFDYSNYTELKTIIENTQPYSYLSDYNFIFDNLMKFPCSYVGACSTNGAVKNASLKNQIKNDLTELKLAIKDVNECFNMFAEILEVNISTPTADQCLARYENLLNAYQDMFVWVGKFGHSLSNLYFNYILNDGNPNIANVEEENFRTDVVINRLESRLKYQLSNLSQCYVEMYVGEGLAKKVASGEVNFSLSEYNYYSNANAINRTIDIEISIDNANLSKSEFYQLAIKAQNFQSALNNNANRFIEACDLVDYTTAKDNVTATSYENMSVSIIELNYDLVNAYNSVLADMVSIAA